MPLDPQVGQFLDTLKAVDRPPFEAGTPQQAREQVVAHARALGPPEPVRNTQDRDIPGPDGEIPVRIYEPNTPGPLPVFVYYHGGGWVVGDVRTHDNLCCQIANAAECLVVSVEYRLAPENRYPAAIDDAYAATDWVFQNAASIGGDAARIAIGGDSSGANLAAVVALMARDREAFEPVLQVLTYPVIDFSFDTRSYQQNAEGYMLTRETMRWFWDCYLGDARNGHDPYASPLRATSLESLPPALVQTAEFDPLCNEGEAYAKRLQEAGVPVTLTRYHGMIHAFLRLTNLFDQASVAVAEIASALRAAFSRDECSSEQS